MRARLKTPFPNLSFSQRFMLASLLILLVGMFGIGLWVEKQIESSVVHHTGATTALFVDSFVSPNLQGLGESNELSPYHVDKLNSIFQNSSMGQQIVAFKVWDTRGRLLFTTDASTVGRTYPMHEGMLRARLGEVVSAISSLDEEENALLGATHDRLLETYSPVWLHETNQIIAVAEFYQLTDDLDRQIGVLQRRSWLVVGSAILLMYLLLAGFVRSASNTITRQQSELGRKVTQLTELLAQNQELHGRVRRAAASVALLNETYLRSVGSELHDGPAQELGLSLLNLDAVISQLENDPSKPPTPGSLEKLSHIQGLLQNALREMRSIATGLSLPQLAELSLPESVIRVVRSHERRTGTPVALELRDLPEQAPLPLKITVYRLIQEALNNAYRHAGGLDQCVTVDTRQDQLVVQVSDGGSGFQLEPSGERDGHLGISGMRERVESLGGEFRIESTNGQGTQIVAYLPFQITESQSS